MKTYANKKQEQKHQPAAKSPYQKNSHTSPAFQLTDNRPKAITQRRLQKAATNSPQSKKITKFQAMADNYTTQQPIQKKENKTGLPDKLKSGIERLSNCSMDDVKVHYNSGRPAQLQAHAYAQGNNIHLGAEQEKHLPHEAWHIVQQKQGRVKATTSTSVQLMDKISINDDTSLEKEADIMGARACEGCSDKNPPPHNITSSANKQPASTAFQLVRIIDDGGTYRKATDKDDSKLVIDSLVLETGRLNELVDKIMNDGNIRLASEIVDESSSSVKSLPVDLDELFSLSDEIAKLAIDPSAKKLEKDDALAREKALAEIKDKLILAQLFINRNLKNPKIQVYKDIIGPLVKAFQNVSGDEDRGAGAGELDITVSPQNITDYRNELKQMGTFAGLAEANQLAIILNIQAPIFVIRNQVFREIDIAGRGLPRVGTWALVHLGNHYEVVSGVVDGTNQGAQTNWLATGLTGNCLFESMILISKNGLRVINGVNLTNYIQSLRNQTSTGLSDADIVFSIQEMLMYGNPGSAGEKTEKLVKSRRRDAILLGKIKSVDENFINKKISSLSKLKGLNGYGLDNLRDKYIIQRKKSDTSNETITAFNALNEMFVIAMKAYNEAFPPIESVNVQDMLTESYWKKQLLTDESDDSTRYADIMTKSDFWKEYSGGSGRSLLDILQTVGPKLLKDLKSAGESSKSQLKLYRGMKAEDAESVMKWFSSQKDATEKVLKEGSETSKTFHERIKLESNIGILPLKNHLGDETQARKYYTPGKNCLLEFTLKPGAHEILFNPEYMAIGLSGSGVTRILMEIQKGKKGSTYQGGSENEGGLAGYIGVKAEKAGDYSIAISDSDATRLLFQLLIANIRIIGK